MNIATLHIAGKRLLVLAAVALCGAGFFACSSSKKSAPVVPPPPPPPAAIATSGVISDGPVTGGSIFVFTADQLIAALASVDPDGDRLAALTAATSIASLTRADSDGDQFAIAVPGTHAGAAAFLIFDNSDAADAAHKDTPPNLESVVILGAAGSTQRINLSLQTTLISQLVRTQLDPEGDGSAIPAAAIQTEIDSAKASVLAAFARDALGRNLYPVDFEPMSSSDDALVHRASAALGSLLRVAASVIGVDLDEVVAALAADAADGIFDGVVPVTFEPSPELELLVDAVRDIGATGGDDDIAVFAVGPCSSAAVALRQACAVDVIDNLFEAGAICADTSDDAARAECIADADLDREESAEECDAVFDARLGLCAEVNDAAHEPAFGPGFAANFVNPLDIGGTVTANPWFPLVTGNRWDYAGDGETIEVVVTAETKLIDGITCVVVIDTAREDGVVVEITRDWYAQDTDGNVWYCGEIARNFAVFEGDVPMDAELEDVDGSWKAGRDGAEPGILLPFAPEVDAVIRQEVLFGEAEDVIRVDSITATESSAGGACVATCLQTTDTTPLEPEVAENKYYAPGIGLIVEIDVVSGDRVELTRFTPGT